VSDNCRSRQARLEVDPLRRPRRRHLFDSWIEYAIPPLVPKPVGLRLMELLDLYCPAGISFTRQFCEELAPTVDNNIVGSMLRLLDCFLSPYQEVEGKEPPSKETRDSIISFTPTQFIFALIWSVGATVNDQGRAYFDAWLRSEMASCGVADKKFTFPNDGLVYDYFFDTDKMRWVKWMDTQPAHPVDPKKAFAEIIVSTMDSIRNEWLLNTLVDNKKHLLMVGETGTGKTVNISTYLSTMKDEYVPMVLSFSRGCACRDAGRAADLRCGRRQRRGQGQCRINARVREGPSGP
jgi:dynein heavy chain